jgi:putative SOS response-associated peptidase YedK
MCGRYLIAMEEEIVEMREIIREISRRYAGRPELPMMKKGEIFPTDMVPVIALEGGKPEPHLFTWGFPHWRGSGVIINARSETAGEKKMFSQALKERRCIIPSSGFYEWHHREGKKHKDKYLLRQSQNSVLYMAGLYTVYQQEGINRPAFVILTTGAHESVRVIHDRMPVIVKGDEQEKWLQDEDFAHHVLKREGPFLEMIRQ